MRQTLYFLMALAGMLANVAVYAHGGESHGWEDTTLKPATRQQIEAGAQSYHNCLDTQIQQLLKQAGDSRQQTDSMLKACEAELLKVKQAFKGEKVPDVIAERYMKRLRTQGAREALRVLMFAEAERAGAVEAGSASTPVTQSMTIIDDAVAPASSEVDEGGAGILPAEVNFDLIPKAWDRFHVGLLLLVVLLVAWLMSFLLKDSKPLPPVTRSGAIAPADAAAVKTETVVLREATPEAALQLLSLLQKEARFVDFIQEDVAGFSDAEIGAAARVVHAGCRKILQQHMSLSPVCDSTEGDRITLPEGYDAAGIRISGNILGQPPFTGTLIHRGWRVVRVDLPQMAQGHEASIIAAAEVEL